LLHGLGVRHGFDVLLYGAVVFLCNRQYVIAYWLFNT
jgi:hypothetical protein